MDEKSLALSELSKIYSERKNAYNLEEFIDDSMISNIKQIVGSDPVYIYIHARFDDRPYICMAPFMLLRIEFMLEDDVLETYPFLAKYPKWGNLFDEVNDSGVYFLNMYSMMWLEKKTRQYNITSKLY